MTVGNGSSIKRLEAFEFGGWLFTEDENGKPLIDHRGCVVADVSHDDDGHVVFHITTRDDGEYIALAVSPAEADVIGTRFIQHAALERGDIW